MKLLAQEARANRQFENIQDKTFRRGTSRKLRIRVKIRVKVELVIFGFYYLLVFLSFGFIIILLLCFEIKSKYC